MLVISHVNCKIPVVKDSHTKKRTIMKGMKRIKTLYGVLGGCSLGLLTLLLSPAYAQSPTVHQLGVLGADDEQFSSGGYFDSYEIEGSEGQRVTISLDSSDFDAFLGLFDSSGTPIATNNDASESNQNAFISMTLPHDDTYTVVAASSNVEGRGDYRMALRNFSAPQPESTASSSESWGFWSALIASPLGQEIMWSAVDSMFSSGGSSNQSSVSGCINGVLRLNGTYHSC